MSTTLENLALAEGILRESTADKHRIVVWVPGAADASYRYWERIGSAASTPLAVEQGVRAMPARSLQVRQKIPGAFDKLMARFRKGATDQALRLPNGEYGEQFGARKTDLLLVWAEGGAVELDESRIAGHWPNNKGVRKLGARLFLVSGVDSTPAAAPQVSDPQKCPREIAEEWLAEARRKGDRQREAAALADLGILLTRESKHEEAIVRLNQALAMAREFDDKTRECDVLGNLGSAMLATGQLRPALELFEQELSIARAIADRYAEKTALDHLASAHANLGNAPQVFSFLEQALTLAREVGDRQQETDLMWYLAVTHAELGQREAAIAHGQATIDLLKKLRKPQADVLAEHLQRYRTGQNGASLPNPVAPAAKWGEAIVADAWSNPAPSAAAQPQGGGPGILRMAISASKAMSRYLGSGMKTTTNEVQQARLATCAACEHHTGMRCKLCGCFTGVKVKLPHESCPIGKWPA